MGKKGKRKIFTAKVEVNPETSTNGKETLEPGKISSHKLAELRELVKTLFTYASSIHNTMNVTKEWELYKEIEKVLAAIMKIESEYYKFEPIERNEKTLEDLITWAKENGCKMDSVTIKEFENYGYGVCALRDIKEEETIISVPRKLMITSETLLNSPLRCLHESNTLIKLMPNVAIALYLLHEKYNLENSYWKHYISFLPNEYSTILYFTSDDLLHLKGSLTFESAMKQCRNIFRQYAHFKQYFMNGDDEVSKLFRDRFTYQDYRWAVSTVMTRLNAVPTQDENGLVHALIPIWDMCNHENGRLLTHFDIEHNMSECIAHRSVKSGEQVFIFYGHRRNADFLVHSGFFYPENEHDGLKILLGISKSDQFYDLRTQLLNKIGISSTCDFVLPTHPSEEYFETELIAFLRVFNMTKEQLDIFLTKDKEELDSLYLLSEPVDQFNEEKTWAFLETRMKLLLCAYPTTIETDLENLQDDSYSLNAKMAINICLAEKRIIQNCLDFIKKMKIKLSSQP